VEQGGFSQRSVLPQQVVPPGTDDSVFIMYDAEMSFSVRSLPQEGQHTVSDWGLRKNTSDTLPHW